MKHTCRTCAYLDRDGALDPCWHCMDVRPHPNWRLHPRYIIIPCAVVGAVLTAAAYLLWGGVI